MEITRDTLSGRFLREFVDKDGTPLAWVRDSQGSGWQPNEIVRSDGSKVLIIKGIGALLAKPTITARFEPPHALADGSVVREVALAPSGLVLFDSERDSFEGLEDAGGLEMDVTYVGLLPAIYTISDDRKGTVVEYTSAAGSGAFGHYGEPQPVNPRHLEAVLNLVNLILAPVN